MCRYPGAASPDRLLLDLSRLRPFVFPPGDDAIASRLFSLGRLGAIPYPFPALHGLSLIHIFVTDVLHDSLTLCNWVWPMTMSPTKARDYRGDLDLEAKFMKAVTGEDVTTEDLYKICLLYTSRCV